MALTGSSSIGDWLDDPHGSPAIEQLLAGFELPDGALDQMKALPLRQLATLSQGKLRQSVIDDMVCAVNGGELPEESPDTPASTRFEGKTYIVTGAAGGIGAAVAARVAREGGRVIAVDLAEERLQECVSAHSVTNITPIAGNIVEQDSIDRIVAAADGKIDGLANVAGINDDFSPLHETSDALWERVIGVNVTGAFKLSRAVIPVMLEAGKGSIVNVASEAALRGNASGNAYTVSKHAVVGMTRSAAFMYGTQGIRVNAVAPGGVATGIPFPANVSDVGSARLQPFQAQIPTIATAEQIAASITFLLSDGGVNINGVVLPSDGGWSVQ